MGAVDVTVQAGDTVEWNFDDALVPHDVQSSSPNWTLSTPTIPPDAPPVDLHVRQPGDLHVPVLDPRTTMSGSVTVEAAADAAHQRARGLQDRRLPPLVDRRGHHGDPAARDRQRLHRRRDRRRDDRRVVRPAARRRVHRREPRAVRRRRLPLDDRRHPHRPDAGGVRALHPGRRRLRRRARRVRHGVHVALVRPAGRRLLPQPPARNAHRRRRHHRRRRALDDRPPGLLDAHGRVVQLPGHQPSRW